MQSSYIYSVVSQLYVQLSYSYLLSFLYSSSSYHIRTNLFGRISCGSNCSLSDLLELASNSHIIYSGTFTWFINQFLLLNTFFLILFYLSSWFLFQCKSGYWTPDIKVKNLIYTVPLLLSFLIWSWPTKCHTSEVLLLYQLISPASNPHNSN